MPLSRLRLRIARGFALAFALALGVLAAGALGYLWREAGRRLEARLSAVANEVVAAVTRELQANPDSSLRFAVNEVVTEWPANDDAFGVADERGVLVAGVNRAQALDPVMGAWARARRATHLSATHGEQDYRVVAVPDVIVRERSRSWRFGVVAFASTEGMEDDAVLLVGALALAAPLIVLLSLVGGYALARRALAPVDELAASIRSTAPEDLSRRLPVREPRDEISALAVEFNALLDRLDEAQRRNRKFVREAAHQIRTPLTLVLGEAGHELSAPSGDAERMRATLTRVRSAAEQMRHRVDELFRLAEAQAGEQVRLEDDVELDGLVLECTDLMRGRASDLGRPLAIGRAEHVTVRGNLALLKEALVELIENGCRHAQPGAAVTVSSFGGDTVALLEVESTGEPFAMPGRTGGDVPEGLGLPIVDWIARAHGGQLRVSRDGERNVVTLQLPVTRSATAATAATAASAVAVDARRSV